MMDEEEQSVRLLQVLFPRESRYEKNLLSHIQRKHEYHCLIQNKIDQLTKNFIIEVEKEIERFVTSIEDEVVLFTEKCLPIMERNVPSPVRCKSEDLLAQALAPTKLRDCTVTPSVFVKEITSTVRGLLDHVDSEDDYEDDDDDHHYRGLDSDRDTAEQVENIVRIVPEVLVSYPFFFRYLSPRSVAFIPQIAQLRIELFDGIGKKKRGGLLNRVAWYNTLQRLVMKKNNNSPALEETDLADDPFAVVLQRLKEAGLLLKEDVEENKLLNILVIYNKSQLPEDIFRVLVDLNPHALTHTSSRDGLFEGESLPLHIAAHYSTIKGFRSILISGIRYFPKKKGVGLLFKNDDKGETPFKLACERHGRSEVMEIIESVLIECSDKPYNALEVLLSSAVDDEMNIDGVYFFLRREPEKLKQLTLSNND